MSQFDARNKLLSKFRRRNENQSREKVGVEFNEAVLALGDRFGDDGFPRLDVIKVSFFPQIGVQDSMREFVRQAESVAVQLEAANKPPSKKRARPL